MSAAELPLVSIVMPIRNEARFIERNLDDLLAQDYPADRIEITVADGMSDDGTRAILAAYCAKHSRRPFVDIDGVILAGANQVAVDTVAAELMGFDAARVPMLAHVSNRADWQGDQSLRQANPVQFAAPLGSLSHRKRAAAPSS